MSVDEVVTALHRVIGLLPTSALQQVADQLDDARHTLAASTYGSSDPELLSAVDGYAQAWEGLDSVGQSCHHVAAVLHEYLTAIGGAAVSAGVPPVSPDSSSRVAEPHSQPRRQFISVDRLNPEQATNLKRYEGKLPSKHEPVEIEQLSDGAVRMSSKVPSNNIPGSYAEYIKVVDKEGNTVQYVKDTYGPDGVLIHRKTKM
ncbi:hypothetical protein [Saccharomonospora iraqiensis]|uniref:hypothetical protein n=1 Tax=Saccharomonospora iraqiensis TaxID=52698 RepID=UPI000412D2D4|nr:hypothetical protein [Saccharomonospora iraqiensis]